MKFKCPALVGLAATAALFIPAGAAANPKIIKAPATSQSIDIAARYAITLNGFNLGALQFNSRQANGTYTASSDVEISALLGAFRWHGVTRASGTIVGARHQPQAYAFRFDGSARSGSIDMQFSGTEVSEITALPGTVPAPGTVPLQRTHLQNALDPLSAILALTHSEGGDPCARKLAIFDGKQRFDLQLSFRRREAVQSGDGDRGEIATVCKVKYSPIGGYWPSADTRAMAQSNEIEITFRRISQAGVMVPTRVSIPTLAGTALLEAERVEIDASGQGQIALVD